MIKNEFITFNKADVFEALEDFYQKKTGNKVDFLFDNENEKAYRNIEGLTFKITVEGKGELSSPRIGIQQNYDVPTYDVPTMEPISEFKINVR